MEADRQLQIFIDRFEPEVAGVAREAMVWLIGELPGAVRLIYDNYNALAIGFGPNERARQIICSLALYPRYVSLFLVGGPEFDDPEKLLEGSGATMRHIKLAPGRIFDPAIKKLLSQSVMLAQVPIDPAGDGYTVIKSISAKQRPRRGAVAITAPAAGSGRSRPIPGRSG
jgi:hypothetical protein